jgi:hypothetical protein
MSFQAYLDSVKAKTGKTGERPAGPASALPPWDDAAATAAPS